jgi:hypothetical protein
VTRTICAGLWLSAMLLLSAPVLTSCAAKPPEIKYLRGSSETIPLIAGECAPFDGWLLSDEALIDLLECCGDKQPRN